MEKEVQAFLKEAEGVSAERLDIISSLRDLFLKEDLGFKEGFKYGGITYSLSHDLIGGLYSYKEHVSIEFSHGANLSDPHGSLEGGGKHRRHIKIREITDIDKKSVASYIQRSASGREEKIFD